MGAGSRRSLCAALDIKGWSKRLVPEQIRAQQALVSVGLAACREAGLPEEIVQSSGDGVLIMPPSDIDESTVIPALVSELEVALRHENRLLAEAARIRLRLALTSGLVTPGPAGFNGTAVIDCFRLLDSPPVKAALEDHPQAQLAVIVSDHLFQDVVRNGFRSLRAESFWRVRSTVAGKGFSMDSWLYVSDRTGGPAEAPSGSAGAPDDAIGPEPEAEAGPGGGPSGPVVEARALLDRGQADEAMRRLEEAAPDGREAWAALLDVRAEALMRLGEYERAALDLEERLGLRGDPVSPPGPVALLRLGRCHAALGAVQAARQTWTFLLEHCPSSVEAYLELGRLERRAGRAATAQNYLVEGLRLVRGEPRGGESAEADRLLDGLLRELSALPVIDDTEDDGVGGPDQF
ncbi:tetratricopeptide repeat protein [Actinomadura sp. 7K507]|uniref:tetratricopeptide repeat protein n=1 Tax=Actinomadura sp. 7K507 TaxID=2530365 RepID=UPI001045E750|nr:tetratricopeptide repeat protein [Actinomadura sp. 7K507]TDC83520.1 tetratricopeptide repeat protein [Actinomadura sp. 7K507]